MPDAAGGSRTRLVVHALEERVVPAGLTDTFDTPGPALGAAWAESAGADVFSVVSGAGTGGTPGVISTGTSVTAGRAWQTAVVSADTGAAVRVKLDSLVPTLLIVRGTALDTSSPTYVAAAVSRGVTAEVWDVEAGRTTVRGGVTTGGASYFSGGWATVTLVPTGTSVALRVQREDTGAYLTPQGTWQSAAADAVVTTTSITGGGLLGVGRAARYSGNVSLDDFTALPPTAPAPAPAVGISQSFDATPAGTRPAGWSSWSAGGGDFLATAARGVTGNGFASAGGSASAARAWSDAALPADVDASAALFLDGIIPAQVFARGTNLDTAAPTYYAVTAVRGMEAKIVKVVNGVETTLGTVKSASWFTTQWVRVRLTAEDDRLRVQLYRADSRQWLTPAGAWSSSPDFALEVRDGSIAGGGRAGVARGKQYSGTVTFDDFEARPASAAAGPVVTITGVVYPTGSTGGDVTFRAAATGSPTRLEFVLNGQVRSASATSPAEWTFDTTTVVNGTYTLTVRVFDAAGNVGSVDRTFTVSNPNNEPVPKPTIPRKFPHVRVAQLAYSGNPMGAYEQSLLRTGVDVVVPNARFMQAVNSVAPDTPQLLYSNVSNLYQGLLADWLEYADRLGVPREQAFYHVTQATPFAGTSPSSQPVTWLWSAYQSDGSAAAANNVTSAARGGGGTNLSFGGAGRWTALGSLDKFRELNVTLAGLPQTGWGGVWEYVSAADPAGNPQAWKPLTALQDGTAGLKRSGGLTFDPPADWKTASVGGGDRQYYVRFRVTTGTAAQAAQLKTVFGRDYVRAAGTQAGVIPAFDFGADRDGDGYLNDAEFAARAAGKDARFVYESRLFYPYYGQMRFVTNPSGSAVRRWAAEYHVHLLAANPLADGVFMDNATGKLPFAGTPVLEATATFSADSGALIAAVNRAISPRWVMANTAGGGDAADAVTAGAAASIEEFLIRPLTHSWTEFGDTANLVARRLAADGAPYLVIDSRSDGGSATDPRTQLATLAYYYLLADADRTFLMFYGGESPSTGWAQHWSEAVRVDVGRPTAAYREVASGRDPLSPSLRYKVFGREYTNGLVLYKPLSYAQGTGEGTTNAQTATTHALGGSYRRVNADGTLGPVVTSVSLRNGEGAVLVKA